MPGGIWSRAQTLIFGAAVGRASSETVGPILEPVRQRAWSRNKLRVLDLGTLAALAAKGFVPADDLADEAARNGFEPSRLGAATALAQSYPDLGTLDMLQNRRLIADELIDKALSRHGLPSEYHEGVKATFQNLLGLAEVANGVQQGHLPNPGILPDISAAVTPAFGAVTPTAPDGEPPTDVPLTQLDLDPIRMAQDLGFTVDDLRLQANLSGLPPGPAELLTLWNRNEITEAAVDAGLREGHLKTKWSGAFKRMRWAVLSASEYANAYIRAWITHDEMILGGALTGHTPDQMELLYKNRGRPMAPVQAFTAWAREAPHPKIPGEPDRPGTFDEQDFTEALRRSDIQTWYAPVLWHQRFAYPPLFQLGRLAQAKALPEERVRTILKYERYEPQDIDALVTFWYGTKSSAAKEATAADLLTLWDGEKLTREEALADLEALGYPADEAQRKLDLVEARRVASAKTTAISDLHGDFKKSNLTAAEVQPALVALGLSEDAANEILNSWSAYLNAFPPPPPAPVA